MDSPLTARAALLSILAKAPGYGADLIARIQKVSGLRLPDSTVYPALSALECEGYVRRREMDVGSRAMHYDLTAEGRRMVEHHKHVVVTLYLEFPQEEMTA